MTRLRNILEKYDFLLNIKNDNLKGGDEYTLDLKINKI